MALEDGPVPRTPSPEALAQLASPSGFLEVVRGALDGSLPPLPPLRGLLWRVCLGVLPSPVGSRAASPAAVVASWRTDVRQKRAAYEHLKAEFTAAPAGDGDPLADNTEWTAYFASRSLLTEIEKDTTRLYPDGCGEFFQDPALQNILSNALFVWCREHPVLSYRQGMHELAAALLWTVYAEKQPAVARDGAGAGTGAGTGVGADADTATDAAVGADAVRELLGEEFMEADCYLLLSGLMAEVADLFDANDSREEQLPLDLSANQVADAMMERVTDDNSTMPSVLRLCTRVLHLRLRAAVPAVHRNLTDLGVEPQLFGLRWVRLLFMREFPLGQLERLWDALFVCHLLALTADAAKALASGGSKTLPPQWKLQQGIEWVATAMLVHLRDRLSVDDYTTVLTTLMSPFTVDDPHSVFEAAVTLLRNGGRLPVPPALVSAPPAPALPMTTGAGAGSASAPAGALPQPGVAFVDAARVPALLRDFYMRTNPSKAGSVDGIVASYRGREQQLMEDLWRRYGDSPVGDPQRTRVSAALPQGLASPASGGARSGSAGSGAVPHVRRVVSGGATSGTHHGGQPSLGGKMMSLLSGAGNALKTAVRAPVSSLSPRHRAAQRSPSRHITSSSLSANPFGTSSAVLAASSAEAGVASSGAPSPAFADVDGVGVGGGFIASAHPNARFAAGPTAAAACAPAPVPGLAPGPAAPGHGGAGSRASTVSESMGHRLAAVVLDMENEVAKLHEATAAASRSVRSTSGAVPTAEDPLGVLFAGLDGDDAPAGSPPAPAAPPSAPAAPAPAIDLAVMRRAVGELKTIRDVLLGRLHPDFASA